MKSVNRRDLEKHWAEQSRKRTPAEQLQFKAEKLRKKIEQAKTVANPNGEESNGSKPDVAQAKTSAGKPRKKSR